MLAIAYLDNSATTPVSQKSAEIAVKYMCETFGNPASVHNLGIEVERGVEAARSAIAKALGAQKEEITFTSGGTESNNLAVLGGSMALRRSGNKIITTAVEHPSVLQAVKELENRGFEVVYLPVHKNGVISLADLEQAVDEKTVLISVMLVNNETGAIQPVEQIRQIVKAKKTPALIHTDCVQAFGKLPFTVSQLQVDLLTVSGHKIHAPKGVGALYIRKGVRILPQTYGGGQENGLRSGTVATSQIAALGAAVTEMPDPKTAVEQATQLKDQLMSGISAIDGVQINSPENGSPFITNLSVPGIPSEVMIRALEAEGVYVSGGSACAKGARSHVLNAQGVSPKAIDSALRVSFSHHTTSTEIEQFLTAFQRACCILHKRK
ncbi:MAG: cysteine desulfurase [Clostridia bacterium]|nr:cysteine desulfurase [Clostridia bacterium]